MRGRSLVAALVMGGVLALAASAALLAAPPPAARAVSGPAVELFEREVAYVHARVMRRYHLSRDDAERWWSGVRYSADGAISRPAIAAVLAALRTAGVAADGTAPDAVLSSAIAPIRD